MPTYKKWQNDKYFNIPLLQTRNNLKYISYETDRNIGLNQLIPQCFDVPEENNTDFYWILSQNDKVCNICFSESICFSEYFPYFCN